MNAVFGDDHLRVAKDQKNMENIGEPQLFLQGLVAFDFFPQSSDVAACGWVTSAAGSCRSSSIPRAGNCCSDRKVVLYLF